MTTLREAAEQALSILTNDRDHPAYEAEAHQAAFMLRAALAQPEPPAPQPPQAEPRSQRLADAGFTPRDTRLTCDECGKKFTRQMLPIHECDELVYVVPEDDAESFLALLNAEMRTPPKWLPDIVLWSEGSVADSYGEAK